MDYKKISNLLSVERPENVICKTNPNEFLKFHSQLMRSAPPGYSPFYFPLEIGGKDPLAEISFLKNRKTVEESIRFLKFGYNVGILAAPDDPLVIIDIDDPEQVPEIKPTLQVISSKQIGTHNYYFTTDKAAKCNIPTEDAGEVRASGYYVVAPGSFVTRSEKEIARIPEELKQYTGQYRLANNLPAANIVFDEFPPVYKDAAKKEADAEEIKAIRREKITKKMITNTCKSALWDLSIYDVLGVRDNPGVRFPMPTEFHGSETGKNASVSKGTLHCWRHMCYHTGLTALAVMAGVATCSEAGIPHGSHGSSLDFSNPKIQFELWAYAYQHGLLPKGDRIPSKALRYYAEMKGIVGGVIA